MIPSRGMNARTIEASNTLVSTHLSYGYPVTNLLTLLSYITMRHSETEVMPDGVNASWQ